MRKRSRIQERMTLKLPYHWFVAKPDGMNNVCQTSDFSRTERGTDQNVKIGCPLSLPHFRGSFPFLSFCE